MNASNTHTIGTVLGAHEKHIRAQIEKHEFQCLRSLLRRVSDLCLAEYCAVVRYCEKSGRVSIKREGYEPRGDVRQRQAYLESLQRVLERWLNSEDRPEVGDVLDFSVTATARGAFLVVRRVLPPQNYVDVEDATFWLVIVDPRLAFGDNYAYLTQELVVQYASVVSHWFARKRNLLDSWKHDIGRRWNGHWKSADPRRDVGQFVKDLQERFRGGIIRPVSERAFSEILDSLVPEAAGFDDWLQQGVMLTGLYRSLADDCRRCRGTCPDVTCFLAVTCSSENPCPQTEQDDRVIVALADCYAWRTSFWKDLIGEQCISEEGRGFLKERLDGLRQTAAVLDERYVAQLQQNELGERSLLTFFAAQAINSAIRKFLSTWKDSTGEQFQRIRAEQMEWLAQMADLCILLLADREWTADAIENLIRVFAGFGHEVLDVPPWLDLARHLRQTLRGEPALHTLKRRYRDHFFHTIEVCLLGFVVLMSYPGRHSSRRFAYLVLRRCRKGPHRTGQEQFIPANRYDFLRQWWVASLIHDTAYGIDVLKGTLDLLDYFRNDPSIPEFRKGVSSAVQALGREHRKLVPELGSDISLEKGDHGAITASHLLQTLKRYGEVTARQFLPAVRAIAFHNTKNVHVDGASDPVAALLILCDSLQDWGRSQLGYDQSPAQVLARLVASAPRPPEEQFGPVRKFGFSMVSEKPLHHRWRQEAASSELVIDLWYNADRNVVERTVYNWADMTHNLQRVDYRSWGIEFRVRFWVPVRQAAQSDRTNRTASPESAMQFFTRIVKDGEAGFLKAWLDAALASEPHAAVYYHRQACNDEAAVEYECLEFRVSQLFKALAAERPLMGGSLADFAQAVATAKARNSPEQRAPV